MWSLSGSHVWGCCGEGRYVSRLHWSVSNTYDLHSFTSRRSSSYHWCWCDFWQAGGTDCYRCHCVTKLRRQPLDPQRYKHEKTERFFHDFEDNSESSMKKWNLGYIHDVVGWNLSWGSHTPEQNIYYILRFNFNHVAGHVAGRVTLM